MSVNRGQYADLMDKLSYQFKNISLLREALTHPSIETGVNYQRLEFVGDRVLGLLISEWLYEVYDKVNEGGLSSRYTYLVRKETLAEINRQIGLDDYIHMAKSAEENGGLTRDSVLSDVTEAVLGAVYLDGGIEPSRKFIREYWKDFFTKTSKPLKDAKTRLQELVQGKYRTEPPAYELVKSEGPAHAPYFTVAVKVSKFDEAQGQGRSKREAEQNAADNLIELIKSKSKN